MTLLSDRGIWRWHVGALAVYAACSFLFIDHGASITRNILGISSDPFLLTWFLSWWPWSIAHHMNPLYTNLVWQPAGLHLVWTTCVPLLALVAAPVTLLWGPVPAYNLMTLAAPVLSAGSAYLLSLRLTHRPAPSVIAGYLFGFSTYEMSETLAHLNLDLNFLVPLVALAILERLQNRLSRMQFAAVTTLLLVAQFYMSVEIFATTIFFAGVSWLLAIGLLPAWRIPLRRLFLDGIITAPFVLLLISPLLWPMLMQPRDVVIPAGWSYVSAAHLLNLLFPVPETVLGNPQMRPFNNGLFGIPESDLTTGLPVLIILWLYARENWRRMQIQFIYMLLAIILLASLGPQLWAGPIFTRFVLPWRLMLNLPLIASAMPVRFALYTSLITALLVAFWLCSERRKEDDGFGLGLEEVSPLALRPSDQSPNRSSSALRWRRLGIGIMACVLQLPSPHPVTQVPRSAFFAPGNVQQRLGFQPRLLILPEKDFDVSNFWQAENWFGFSQTTGYLGLPPISMQSHPAVTDIMFRWKSGHLDKDIAELCFATNTQFVVASPRTPPELYQAMKELGWPERSMDGMRVFTVQAVVPGRG